MNGKTLIASFRTPLAAETMAANDFFALYPNDGGGGFVMQKELTDAGDRAITELILRHNGMSAYGTLPQPDYHIFDDWLNIERCSWINRLYFLPPLARIAYLDKDTDLARLVIDTMLYFKRTQRPPENAADASFLHQEITRRRDEEYNEGKGSNGQSVPYQWYDFQPAARIIHILHAMAFLRDMECITDSEADELAEMIFEHAQVICWQEEEIPLRCGNHQALRGLSLIYAGCFSGEKKFLENGIRIMEFHIINDFAPDGLLREASPTYHCFEGWIARDTCALADKYDLPLAPEAFERFKACARAARVLCRPDGRAVVLNDGCNLDMAAFTAVLPEYQDEKASEHILLDNNNIAVWKTPDWYMLLDMSHFTGKFSHYHAGKNGLNIWYKNRPFITDSGCCDYDAPEFKGYFKNGEAHASMLVDGMGDGKVQGTYNWIHYAELKVTPWQENTIIGTLTSTVPNWNGITWSRKVHAADNRIVIADKITADKEHQYEFIYPLHPDCTVEISGTTVHLRNNGEILDLEFFFGSLLTIGLRPAWWCDGGKVYHSKALRIMLIAAGAELKTVVFPGK